MSFPQKEEKELLERIRRGEKKAWEEFVEFYARLIYYAIRRTLEKKGRKELFTEVEDIFQAFFIHLAEDNARRLTGFSGNCSLASWIRILAINFTIDILRRKSAFLEVEFKLVEKNPVFSPSTPLKAFEEKEKQKKLEQAISRLEESEQEFLKLYLSELSPTQLARIYRTTVNKVYSRYARIKEKIKKYLDSE